MRELYWAAGFMEGEGSFCNASTQVHVQATQVQREPLERLQRLFGGKIYKFEKAAVTGRVYHRWNCYGRRGAAIAMTLYTLMSTRRREQIEKALSVWRAGWVHYNRARTNCRNGHEFTSENTYIYPNGRRECRICSAAYKARHAAKAKQ